MSTESFTKELSISAESLLVKLYRTEMENRKLKKLLKEIEYSASEIQWDYDREDNLYQSGSIKECPICAYGEDFGHAPDCRLAKLLDKQKTLA
jgi:alanyl-tRNA synthetase